MSKAVSVRFIRSDQREFSMDSTLFGITELTGADAPTVEIFKQAKAVGDGDIITGKRVAAREIQCAAKLRDPALNESVRAVAAQFFNPLYTYDAIITYSGAKRLAKGAVLKGFKAPTENVYEPLRITCTLVCPSGYLLGVENFGQDLASVTGRFGFPFISVVGKGFLFGKHNFAQTVEIINDGDADTRFVARMTFDGDVLNPALYNGTSYVRLLGTFGANDEVEIDMENYRVTRNGANAITLVDRGSDFDAMAFAVGENQIRFDADDDSNLMHVTLLFHKRYLGVG